MITVKDILRAIKHSEFIGNDKTVISAPVQASSTDIGSNHLLWVSDKNLNYLTKINLGTIICSSAADKSAFKKECNYIIVENPRLIFQKILNLFFIENTDVFISPTAQIHPACKR